MCEDPGLLPAGRTEVARCTQVANPDVSGRSMVPLESADICIVRGREYTYGDDEAYDRSIGAQEVYYIGGRIGYWDPDTGQVVTLENFGQYWWNWFDVCSGVLILEACPGVFFHELVSCGICSPDKYRSWGYLDTKEGTLRYRHITCEGRIEFDFELECGTEE
jgi:hypothetical protein